VANKMKNDKISTRKTIARLSNESSKMHNLLCALNESSKKQKFAWIGVLQTMNGGIYFRRLKF
jgi:hypothetical protein